ncbi:MAG: 16S rRNA (cytosine(967)-C(5))-methyltransferase RsmB [Chitinispirillales bacterium]|jgi:16S rRNA (cytosine967-C5)-methyltransferase|nr:16S rRNA (cytosine(967)-C(5))-methyltransferase RsmB [Chitinispirillales bacterium]
MMNTRQLVLKILSDFDDRPGDPDRIAEKVLSRKRIEQRDRRFIFEIVYGVLRNRIYLDYVIDRFLSTDRELKLDNVRRILQLGAYQILFLDRVPDHAAVNESVNLAKKDRGAAPAAGLVNAILRNVIKNKHSIVLPDPKADLSGRLSVEFSHPKWMVERWLARYGLGNTKKILMFNNERPDIYLRRSRTHIFSRQQFDNDVRTLCEPGCGYFNLYYKMKKSFDPQSLRILQDGFCTVQAPSSGWVVALLGLSSGDRVADLCAAPGGKTTLMAEAVGEPGAVFAGDRSRWKIGLLAGTIEKLGIKNIYPVICDSVRPPFRGLFDKVLVDAPCSGTGVLQRHPDGRFVRTASDIENAAYLQKKLLDSAANMVGSGGVIVYSTCSLEPEENEDQVARFLSDHPEFELDAPPDAVPAMFVDSKNCLRITPFQHAMDGMFGVRFKKG